jgi:hypothetical protein
VEAAVRGIVVLALAFGAHLEAGHRGRGAVIRNRAGYGEARAAVGAVGERVAVAAIRRVEDLPQAVFAGGDIRRYERPSPDALPAFLDPEALLAKRCERTPGDCLHDSERWGFFLYPAKEEVQPLGLALHLDVDSLDVVADQPGEPVPPRQGVDEGPEPHALHDAPDGDLPPLLCWRSHGVRSRSTTPTCSLYSDTS